MRPQLLPFLTAASLVACGNPQPVGPSDDDLLIEVRAAIETSAELPLVLAGLEERGCSWDPDASPAVVDQRDGQLWGVVFDALDCDTTGRRAVPMILAHRATADLEWQVVVGSLVSDEPTPGGSVERLDRQLLLVDETGVLDAFPIDAENARAIREWYAGLPAPSAGTAGDVGSTPMGISDVVGYRQASTACYQALGGDGPSLTCCACQSDAQQCLSYQAMTPMIAVDCYRTLVCNGGREASCANGLCGQRPLYAPQDWEFTFDLEGDNHAAATCAPGDAGCHTYDSLCDPYRLSGDFASSDLDFCAQVYQGFDIGDIDSGEYPTFSGQVVSVLSTASLVIAVVNPVAGVAGVTLTSLTGIAKFLDPLKSLFGLAGQTVGNFDALNRWAGDGSFWGPQGLQLYCGSTELAYRNCHLPLCLTTYGECLTALVTCNQAPTVLPDGTLECATGTVVETADIEDVQGLVADDIDFSCCSTGLHFEYMFPSFGGGFDEISMGAILGIGAVHTPGFECVYYYPEGTVLPSTSWPTEAGSFPAGSGPSWPQVAGADPANFTCTWAPRPIEMDGEGILDLTCGGGP